MRSANREEEIIQHLKEKSRGARIACEEARKIAEDLGVSYKEVGRAADSLKIKITGCALGCF